MKYFDTLPNINIPNGNDVQTYKNLLIRTSLVQQLATNPLVFYKYSIQEGDTPEIVADKYYGDSYRYWMVLYGNQNIMDPQWDWPLDSKQFISFLNDKYSANAGGVGNVLSYTQQTIHHYEKITTTVDGTTGTTAMKNVEVDYDTYASIQPFTQTQSFPDGSSLTYTISTTAISIYDYELGVNESKRNINIINSRFATQLEQQFEQLVNI
jgi:hypothetical protein